MMVATLPILPPAAVRKAPLAEWRSGGSIAGRLAPPGGGDLVAALLAEQASLTAVERFSRTHASTPMIEAPSRYAALLPATPPRPGQQYAFEVDLDLCSGCKACVTACHNLNGLDEGESWRDVGLLHGGTPEEPFLQHVTTACHHCLDPACAKACPVDAYEKDPATGIVLHLDDQCFGCQYCTLACPYDVPKYHAGKGIVRKCDLCRGRLAAGEPPACAQACPQEAIRVTLVDVDRIAGDAEANAFLPGAPDPDETLPTTIFRTKRALPRNLLPADYFDVRPEHAHWPLVVMLVLTQLSVGGFLVDLLIRSPELESRSAPLFSLTWGLLALAASTLHLGRPHLAFRAVIGLRHSWLSREAVAFGLFAPLAAIDAGLAAFAPEWYGSRPALRQSMGVAVAAAGLTGIGCGVMVYHVVRRAFWHGSRTTLKFLGTAALLGLSANLLTVRVGIAVNPAAARGALVVADVLCLAITMIAAAKLLLDAAVFLHLRDARFTALRRTALLMTGPLAGATWMRFALGGVGGVAMPLLVHGSDGRSGGGALVGAALSFLALVAGELAERYLFFTAVVRQKMPGGLSA